MIYRTDLRQISRNLVDLWVQIMDLTFVFWLLKGCFHKNQFEAKSLSLGALEWASINTPVSSSFRYGAPLLGPVVYTLRFATHF